MINKFQQGGMVPAEPVMAPEGAPAPAPGQGGADQMMAQLEQIAAQILQEMGPEAAVMLAEMLMQMAQGGAPAEQVAYNKKGKKIMKVKKCAMGTKTKKC